MKRVSYKAVLAEIVGTFALVLCGAGAVAANELTGGGVTVAGIALAHGLTIVAIGYALGYVSGAVINPAITIGLLVARQMTLFQAIAYIVAQFFGGFLGALVLSFAVANAQPDAATRGDLTLGATVLMDGLTSTQGLVIEAVGTFFLAFTALSMVADKRAQQSFAPLAIGVALAIFILWAGPLTGASANPARTLGPALVRGKVEEAPTILVVYFIGPVVGAVLAGLAKAYLFTADSDART